MQARRLDTVADITMGQAPDGESYNLDGEGLPLIAGAGDFGELHPEPKKFTSAPGKTCQPGDVILGIRATIGEKVLADGRYCLGRGVAGLRAKTGLDERYLWHWLTHVTPTLAAKAKGATFKQVNREDIGELRITLPPLPEQRRIAEILDKADALRAKRRAALAELDTLTQSIFLNMFGDPATVLHRWPVSKLGEHLEFLTSGSRGWAKHYSEQGDLFLRIQNVRRDELSLDDVAYVTAPDTAEARRTRVEAGDVLLSITADLGRTAVVPKGLGNAFINQHLAILRTKSFVPRFLSAFLASPAGRSQVLRQNRQAVKAGLNFDDIRGFVVPFPPVTIQRKFEATAAAVAASQRAQGEAFSRLGSLFASLQHCAFRGDLKPGLGEVPEKTRDVGS